MVNAGVFDRWLDTMGRAWEAGDPDRAAELFTDDAVYYETPFSEPLRGREAIRAYWAEVPSVQENVSYRHQVVATTDEVGIARWSVSLDRTGSSVHAEFDGVFLVTLDSGGRCREFREWWHRTETNQEDGP